MCGNPALNTLLLRHWRTRNNEETTLTARFSLKRAEFLSSQINHESFVYTFNPSLQEIRPEIQLFLEKSLSFCTLCNMAKRATAQGFPKNDKSLDSGRWIRHPFTSSHSDSSQTTRRFLQPAHDPSSNQGNGIDLLTVG